MRIGRSSILAVAIVAGCGAPQSFEELDPAIKSAKGTGINLNIVAQLERPGASDIAMLDTGELIETIARGVQMKLPGPTPDTQYVQLQLHFDSIGRLGNEGFIDFGTIRFPIADLRAANLENLSGTAWLELADQISPSTASDYAIEYCSDESNFVTHLTWCGALAEGLNR